MKLGVNYPWVHCGHDFGPKPPPWAGGAPTDWGAVGDELARLRALGVRSARWWVLAGGVNLPCGSEIAAFADRRPFGPGFPAAAERWVPRGPLPALPDAFLDDFDRLLAACEAADVGLWPSLVSFEAFLPIEDQTGGVTSGGRGAVVLDPAFLDAVLEPLLDVCEARPAGVFAVEVVNEPRWAMQPGWLASRFGEHPPWVRAEAMSGFVRDAAERIAARGLTASVGFLDGAVPWLSVGALASLRALAARGRYLHQHHHYPGVTGARTLVPAWRQAIRPCWLGELATSRHGRWHDPGLREDDPTRFLEARLELVRRRGYDGALLWARRATDPHVLWGERTESQARAIAGEPR